MDFPPCFSLTLNESSCVHIPPPFFISERMIQTQTHIVQRGYKPCVMKDIFYKSFLGIYFKNKTVILLIHLLMWINPTCP